MDATQCDSSALDETDIDQDFAVGHRFDGDAIDFESMGEFPLASDDIDVRHAHDDRPPTCPGGEANVTFHAHGDTSMEGAIGPGTLSFPQSSTAADSQPTLSLSTHNAMFSRALLTNCQATDIVLPWETGIFKDIFSDEPFPQSLVPTMPIGAFCNFDAEPEPQMVAEEVAKAAQFSDACPVFSRCVGSADDGHFVEMQSKLHLTAVNKILVVLRHDLDCSVTGRHILALGDETMQRVGAPAIVEAVVGARAPATLVKRANALLSFLRWYDKTCWTDIKPFSEECIWRYLQHLRESAAPATKGSAALSAFRFAHFLLGFDGLGPTLSSRRLVGICEIMLAKKRILKQAMVLTVSQVKGLHRALRDQSRHAVDRAVIAYILFALYGRCRNSDLLMIHSVKPDFSESGGFVTIQTCNHKTGRTAMLKARLLPIVIPARGVDGSVWVADALQALSSVGALLSTPIDGPLLRAPSDNAFGFMQRGLRASEVSAMLRRFVESPDPLPGSESEIISSHSLKATTLSWCARYGLSPAVRSLLGRHASSLNETYAIYSRDLACAPTAELQKVIDAIAEGRFLPDSQRSEFFCDPVAGGEADKACSVAPEGSQGSADHFADQASGVSELLDFSGGGIEPVEQTVDAVGQNALGEEAPGAPEIYHSDGEQSSSTDSSGALTSDESDADEPVVRVKRFRAKIPDGQAWFVHSKSHLIHRFDGNEVEGIKFTVCGKRLTETYGPCTEATAWNILCKSCNRK